MDLSVIIVNYNTLDLTLKALKSVVKAKRPKGKLEVILIDNASDENIIPLIRAKFPQVKTIQNQTNLGFAGANNQGMRRAKGKYVLLLNSDTIISQDTLVKMIDFMDKNPKVGLSTCKVVLVNGQIDPASHRGFPTPWAALTYFSGLARLFPKSKLFSKYHQGWKDLNTTHEIDSPVGAFFFLRKTALNQAGFLDEDFFMYGEDLDLAFRIKKLGLQVVYAPITKITHLKGASGLRKKHKDKLTSEAKKQRLITNKNFCEAMKIFYKKHYQKPYNFPLRWLIFLGIDTIKTLRSIKINLS